MKTLSIIIPVYNAAKYIERCLQSVEAQTLQDIEVILVDDHGYDDGIEIAKTFASRSNREDIQYIFAATPRNSGPSAARNIGIENARGEYIAFLDADDWIEAEMYNTLYSLAKEWNADLSCCNAIAEDEAGRRSKELRNPKVSDGIFHSAEKKHFLVSFIAYHWTFIYRHAWLEENQLRYADAKSAEDSSFLACCVLMAERISQTDAILYHYVEHEGSLVKRRVWKGKDKRKALGEMIRYAKRKGMMRTYWPQLLYVYLKKALLVPVIEMVK